MSESSDLVARMTARRKFIFDGKTKNGISPNVDPETPPAWYDPVAFKHAQKLFTRYKVIIRVSQLYGLNLVLYFNSGLQPLLATGYSENIAKLFTRYLSTMIHVSNWFESDPFDKETKSFKSLKAVRGMHRQVANKMNKADNLEENGTSVLWMNQFSMAHAQFSFIGFMTVFPKQLGFHCFTEYDFHAMFHFWRLIGYCLGTDDNYNLSNGTDEEIFELCRQIYFEEWLPVIREEAVKTGVEMSKGICIAMSRVNPNLNFNSLMRYGSDFMLLDKNKYKLENFREKCLYVAFILMFKHFSKFKTFHWIMAKITDVRMKRAIDNKDKHRESLAKLYPDIHYTAEQCPYDINFNYVNAFQLK